MEESANLAVFGAGLVVFAAAFGIGWIGSQAMKAMSRQPEAAPNIQTSMLIACALIEGVALFGAVICFLAAS